jgi:hypothetical protein
MRIDGACHCGALRFALDWPEGEAAIPARACGCTFCRKHGASWTAHPAATLAITATGPLSRYAFGTKTADFLVCAACGVPVAALSRIDGQDYAVVNVNTFEGFDTTLLDRTTSDFEGEAVDDRLARRRSRWIADVRFD